MNGPTPLINFRSSFSSAVAALIFEPKAAFTVACAFAAFSSLVSSTSSYTTTGAATANADALFLQSSSSTVNPAKRFLRSEFSLLNVSIFVLRAS